MRILVDAHVFDGAFQGTRTYLEGLYTHMTQHCDIEFYFAARDIENIRSVFGVAQNIHYIPLNSSNKWRRLAYEFPRIINDYCIDYAHFQYISPLKKNCKVIDTLHDLLFLDMPQFFSLSYRIPKQLFFGYSAKRADILLTVSEYSKCAISNHFGIDKDNIFITYNSTLPDSNAGIDISIENKYGFNKYILTVSRIEPRKNHLALIKAFVGLGLIDKGYHLVMVGAKDISYQSFFDYLGALDEQSKSYIHLIQVPFNDLVALYRSASLFVFPSFGEGFGIPPIEAISYGCPLLCSNVTAMAEFGLPDEITFNPYNLEELKVKMMEQLENPLDKGLYANRVLSKYNWSVIANYYYEILMKG